MLTYCFPIRFETNIYTLNIYWINSLTQQSLQRAIKILITTKIRSQKQTRSNKKFECLARKPKQITINHSFFPSFKENLRHWRRACVLQINLHLVKWKSSCHGEIIRNHCESRREREHQCSWLEELKQEETLQVSFIWRSKIFNHEL